MDKRKITAREIVRDMRAGADDQTLMKKFRLSAQGLQSVFGKLVKAGVITQDELEDRVPMTERTVDLGLYICPACGNIQDRAFDECPRCGFVPPGARKSKEETKDKKESPGKARPKAKLGRAASPAGQPETEATGADNAMKPPPVAGPVSRLTQLVSYCRILAVAALVSYGLIIAGSVALVYLSVPPSALLGVQILLSLLAMGVPAVALSVVIFIALQALAESIKVFADVSEQFLGTQPEDRS